MRRIVLLLASMAVTVLLASGVVLVAPVEHAEAAFPGKNGKIAFSRTAWGEYPDIYTIDPDGSNLIPITSNSINNPGNDIDPAGSPEGDRLVFLGQGDRDRTSCFTFELYTVNADGSDQNQLTNDSAGCASSPSWSPDGTKIVYESNPNPNGPAGSNGSDIYVMNSDGTDRINITGNPADDKQPVWSPDGTRIAFVSSREGNNYDIYTVKPDGSRVTRITNDPGVELEPDWSPDSEQLTFAGQGNRDPRWVYSYEVYTVYADGSNQIRLTSNSVFDGEPAWSPDGTKIVFIGTTPQEVDIPGPTVERDIYLMNADGSNPTNLTDTPAEDEWTPDWQPLPGPTRPETKADCKKDGYKVFDYKNQGQCIMAVKHTD